MIFVSRAAVLVSICIATLSHAQQKPQLAGNYPYKPIRVIVGTAPGGGTDITARAVAQGLSERWRHPVVIENRASGIGGVVGMDIAVKATPDGYTLLVTAYSTVVNATVGNQLPYDVRKVLAPVAQFTSQPYALAVTAGLPVATLRELIAYAKAKPGTLNFGSSGTGSIGHLGMVLFNSMVGTEMTHIPYKSTGQALIDLLGGQIQLVLGSVISVMPQTKTGRIRVIATSSLKHSQLLPELPTIAESGLPGFEFIGWYGLFAPAGTPQPIINALNHEVVQILRQPEIQRQLANDGAEAAAGSPEVFRERIARDIDKAVQLVRDKGIKL